MSRQVRDLIKMVLSNWEVDNRGHSGDRAKFSTTTKTFTLLNNCKGTIWPGVITKGDSSHGAGFTLNPGQTAFYNAPTGWSGRIWARTGCNFDKNGTGSCQTGSCGTSLNCSGPSSPPNTIAEFTLGDIDFYDVSLVDGFNLPIVVQPLSGKGNCSIAGCDGDVRNNCPTELSVRSDGKGFKQVCPAASSYAFDRDATSIITCSASDYIVTFCASRNQSFCSYHDNKVMCNATNSSKALPLLSQGWWNLMVTLPLAFVLQIKI
ncbi:hypothetical protein GH714_004597 [Hevea brasiliensis]|uniref:Thaumatin-like protein n=1 Tax=Hevea brasiliensis TaxID=3981 RepID=A0A6A6KXN1_HEVBR|nr:hypothetical protein GH714_004597 [Hevea brasiliensis]